LFNIQAGIKNRKKTIMLQIELKKKYTILVLAFLPLFSMLFLGCKETADISGGIDIEPPQEEGSTGEEFPEVIDITETEEPQKDLEAAVDGKLEEFIASLYIPDDDFLGLDYEDKEYLLGIAYQAVEDYFKGGTEVDESIFPVKYDGIDNKVFIGFRVKGDKKGSYSAREDNLARSVYTAARRTVEDDRFEGSITQEDLYDLKIEVFILGEEIAFDDNYEKGIHGVRLEKDGSGATFYNSVAIEENYSTVKLLQRLCLKAGLSENCSVDESADLYYFPTIHFASTRFSDQITTFYRCNVIQKRPEFDLEKIKGSLDMAEGWMLVNMDEDGYFNYEYYPYAEDYAQGNNMIRQLMSSKWLADKASQNKDLKILHKVNMEYVLDNWYREDGDLGYIYFSGKSKLGAMAMALRAVSASPYYKDYEDIALKLASTILHLTNDDGSMNAWYIEPDYVYDEERLMRFYSGEAILALLDYYDITGDDRWLDAAVRSQDFYIADYIEDMEQDEDYYPAFIPWHSQCLNRLYKITGDKKYVDAIFKISDKILEIQNQDGKPYIDFLGRFYNPNMPEYGSPHSASTSVYLEGVAYAYEIAEMEQDQERMYEYKKSIVLGVHNLMNLQYKGADMYYLAEPQRVWGAVRVGVEDSRIRIDTTQHTIDAFRKILELFE